MRALVTGGGGFVGGAIVRALLARGDEVVSLARGDYPELRAAGVETLRGDLSDPACVGSAVARCDVVFHVAARASSWGRAEDFVATNVTGTENVVDACRRHGVGRLVFTSSPSATYSGGDVEGADEALPYPDRYLAHYPRTKAIAERRVLAANDAELSTVALRPHLVWGPGDTQLTARIVERAKQGRLRFVGPPKKVDAVYVDNVVDAHLAAADRLAPGAACAGKPYFVTNGEPIASDEMINGILRAAGLPEETRRIPRGVAYAVGAMFEGLWLVLRRTDEPPMTRFVADQLSTAHWFDISAARRDLGYEPRVSLAEGFERLRAWFAEHPVG